MRRGVALAFAVGADIACGSAAFECSDDAQCGAMGICARPGYCAFPDDQCPSKYAFGAHAGAGLAGECVPPDTGNAATDDLGDGGSSTASTTTSTGADTTAASTLALDDTSTHGADDRDPTDVDPSTTSITTDATTTDGGVSTTDSMPLELSFVADFAACAYPDAASPNPAGCAATAGPGAITVDLYDGTAASWGYLAFSIAADLPPGEVLEARLRLHTATFMNADADSSGEVWIVAPFTAATLMNAAPATLGNAAVAPDQGAVGLDQDVVWALPVDVIAAGADVHLAIAPLSENGVDYWAHDGAVPPVLEVVITP